MNPAFVVRAARHADVSGIYRVQWEAFQTLIPRLRPLAIEDPKAFEAATTAKTIQVLNGEEGPSMSWLVATSLDAGQAAAVARWEYVENICAEAFVPATTAAFGGPENVAFYNELKLAHRDIMGTRPHYCLHILATLPEYQRKGAASSLLNHMTQIADAGVLPIYVETAPGKVQLYEKFGFKNIDRRVLPPLQGEPDAFHTLMVRESRSS